MVSNLTGGRANRAEVATHEISGPVTEVEIGSERSFGIVFAVVFAVVGLWPMLDGLPPRPWFLVVAAAFLGIGLLRPGLLRPLNKLWFRFGMLLHHVVTPVVMGLLFFGTVTPVGLLMRASGKDPMRMRRDSGARSYWIHRDPPGPAPGSMKNQF